MFKSNKEKLKDYDNTAAMAQAKRRSSHEPNQMHNHVDVYQCIS